MTPAAEATELTTPEAVGPTRMPAEAEPIRTPEAEEPTPEAEEPTPEAEEPTPAGVEPTPAAEAVEAPTPPRAAP
jgi:hypothetical protein